MIREDTLTSRLVEYYQQSRFEHEVQVEQHYNHYGDRGVVDLVAQDTTTDDIHLYEIKSTAAIESATGANEIIRQFNRMRRYYFRDQSTATPKGNVTFELCFVPTYECYRHVHTNTELYRSAAQADVDIGLSEAAAVNRVNTRITMRPYDEPTVQPAVLFTENTDYRELIKEHGKVNDTMLGTWVTMMYQRQKSA